MDVLVTTECRFYRSKNGEIISKNGMFGYTFWERYLDVYHSVKVIARLSPEILEDVTDCVPVEGPGVSFFALPDYLGPKQYLGSRRSLLGRVSQACKEPHAVILRVPGQIGNLVYSFLSHEKRPYGVEVIGDPYDVFAPTAIRHPLRPLFRHMFTRRLKLQCSRATGASYVTRITLQKRYPCNRYSNGVSDVILDKYALVETPRTWCTQQSSYTVVNVGTMEQMYKAQDVLIEAIHVCVQRGLDVRLVLVGDGKYRTDFEQLAVERGIRDRVKFTGILKSRSDVRQALDDADLFAMPSRTEGLPRALIEAMARSLPCIGARVGGIPELLEDEFLVSPDDPISLANMICDILQDSSSLNAMAQKNLSKAQEYKESNLKAKRNSFYQRILEETQRWYSE